MRNATLVCIALLAGCHNSCFFDRNNCGAQSRPSEGSSCDPNDECTQEEPFGCFCDSRTHHWHCPNDDLASPRTDLALPRDMAQVSGCGGYVDCLLDCFATTINASQATCEASCAPDVSGLAVVRYDDAIDCAEAHCADSGDAGTARCVRAADGTIVNEDGTPRSPTDPGTGQKRCGLCLHDATAELYGQTCTQPGSVDCNPSSCAASVDACLND